MRVSDCAVLQESIRMASNTAVHVRGASDGAYFGLRESVLVPQATELLGMTRTSSELFHLHFAFVTPRVYA